MKRIFYITLCLILLAIGLALPVSAIVTPNIYTSSGDGYINYWSNVSYATVRLSPTGSVTGGVLQTENCLSGSYYSISKGFLYFDTSALSGYTVTAATLYVYVFAKADANNELIQIQSGMPTYPHITLESGDFDQAYYAASGNGGQLDITTVTLHAYNAIPLTNPVGLAMINTSGITKLALRTTGDINNSTPTGENGLYYYAYEEGGGKIPYLSVTYTATAPAIISVVASNIATTSARLNSTVTDDGGDTTCQIEFGYGLVSQTAANYALYTTHIAVTIPVSDYKEADNPYLDVAGFVAGTPYFYRVKITNEFGSVVSTDEQTFTTVALVGNIAQFVGYPDDDNISLNWLKATGATNTLIRYRLDTYPTTTADGTQIYNGTGVTYAHTGLTGGTTYYYAAWGESGGVYSVNAKYLVMTTTSSSSSDVLPAGTTPSGWMQAPDETFLANLQPFYSVINGLADTWGMPRGNAWLVLSLLFVMVCGVGLYIRFHAASFSLFAMALVIAGFVTLHILPSFMLVFVFFLALGGWSTRPQGI